MAERPEVPDEVVARVRVAVAGLPELREEAAWTGTAWRVRTQTVAQVVAIADGWPPAFAAALGDDGPAVVLTFRSAGDELDVLRHGGPPFFAPPWHPAVVGLVLDDTTDWDEVRELITDSYCALAPRALAARVTRPG